MNTLPYIPENAPFTAPQRAWLNGFLAGMYSGTNSAPAAAVATKKVVNIYFGSESGNSEALSKQVAKAAQKKGFESKAIGLDKVTLADLAREHFALIVTSTFGDGEPPANAEGFHQAIFADNAPKLENLRYSVLALGDKNYEQFCKFGIEVDGRLEALGAKRLFERVDCDVAYEEPSAAWQDGVFSVIEAMVDGPVANKLPVAALETMPDEPVSYSRKNPFPASLVVNRKLTADGSAKETRHFEISLAGSGLSYEVGDALGVVPTNCPGLVEDLLRAMNLDGEEAVNAPDGGEVPLRVALLRHFEITRIPASLLKVIAERSADPSLAALLVPEAKEALTEYLWGREVIDLLLGYPGVPLSPAEFVSHLRKLQPRLYSISSSLNAFPDQVHLTVAAVRYESFGRVRKGVCSTFLADRANGPVPVFVHVSKGFRLPASGDTPIIMVGPGTGIAPFRAFLHDRKATGATGRNWLFFGDQKASTDFLYKEELEGFLSDGHLTKLDTAFSRDQKEKIYVQQRMLENAAELWKWLEDGAHFYVCGDASRMAKDVDMALHKIVETAGSRSPEAAAEYVAGLKTAKRYQRDVY